MSRARARRRTSRPGAAHYLLTAVVALFLFGSLAEWTPLPDGVAGFAFGAVLMWLALAAVAHRPGRRRHR